MEAMATEIGADYPWAEVADQTVMDLNGGGTLIATLLRAFPCFDLPAVIDHIRPFFSEAEVLHALDEMLFDNLDVTIGGLSWNFVFLAADPDTQSRLRAEFHLDQYRKTLVHC